jgi:D-arabinose 5-phosphate isomerase GutQ
MFSKTRFNFIIKNISNSIDSVSEDIFSKLIQDCIHTLANNGKIISSGIGKNVPICEKFDGTLKSLGIPSLFINSNTALHGDLGSVNENDLVLILSKSGSNIEIQNFYHQLLLKKCLIWFISFNSKLKALNSKTKILSLMLQHESDQWNVMPINSSTINMILLHEIAIQLSIELKISLNQFKVNHPGGNIGTLLKNSLK